jgi:hypothetical protein
MGARRFRQTVRVAMIALVSCVPVDAMAASAHPGWDDIASMVDRCRASVRTVVRPAGSGEGARIVLSEDSSTLCFDGAILADQDIGIVDRLRPDGFFVISSSGGHVGVTMRLSDKLREKNARVIVYDVCLSACASYVLIATHKTYVTRGAVVAWHGRAPDVGCDAAVRAALRKRYRELSRPPQQADADCETLKTIRETSRKFFARRSIGERHTYDPQTADTKKYVNLLRSGRVNKRDVFWMWNPKNHRDHFGSIVEYESYPRSQDEVDALLTQWGGRSGDVVFDPALDP